MYIADRKILQYLLQWSREKTAIKLQFNKYWQYLISEIAILQYFLQIFYLMQYFAIIFIRGRAISVGCNSLGQTCSFRKHILTD